MAARKPGLFDPATRVGQVRSEPLAERGKYARLMKGYGWKPEDFARQYNIALRIRPTRLRTG
jgi:hypothetical protein